MSKQTESDIVFHGPYETPAVKHASIAVNSDGVVATGGVDQDTIFGEGSIGKARFAGLAYMLREEGKLDMNERVVDYFTRPEVQSFLAKRFPGQGVAENIIGLFQRDDNKDATLADLTTHHSGVGDGTKTAFETFKTEGIVQPWDLPRLLQHVNRDDTGKVLAGPGQKPGTEAKYGERQYSNLGYQILSAVIESAANKDTPEGERLKTYKDLVKEKMVSRLGLKSTKFPEDLSASDKAARSSYSDPSGEVVHTTVFDGAGSAGGMFTSSSDMQKFFSEFFKGFPGTSEHNLGTNELFSKETIDEMMSQAKLRFTDKDGVEFYQGAGFEFRKKDSEFLDYSRSGETFGYQADVTFHPKTGLVDVGMRAFENTSEKAVALLPSFYAEKLAKETGCDKSEAEAHLMGNYHLRDLQFHGREIVAGLKEQIKEGKLNEVPIIERTEPSPRASTASIAESFSTEDKTKLSGIKATLDLALRPESEAKQQDRTAYLDLAKPIDKKPGGRSFF